VGLLRLGSGTFGPFADWQSLNLRAIQTFQTVSLGSSVNRFLLVLPRHRAEHLPEVL
jgi:hypothetical protein